MSGHPGCVPFVQRKDLVLDWCPRLFFREESVPVLFRLVPSDFQQKDGSRKSG